MFAILIGSYEVTSGVGMRPVPQPSENPLRYACSDVLSNAIPPLRRSEMYTRIAVNDILKWLTVLLFTFRLAENGKLNGIGKSKRPT